VLVVLEKHSIYRSGARVLHSFLTTTYRIAIAVLCDLSMKTGEWKYQWKEEACREDNVTSAWWPKGSPRAHGASFPQPTREGKRASPPFFNTSHLSRLLCFSSSTFLKQAHSLTHSLSSLTECSPGLSSHAPNL